MIVGLLYERNCVVYDFHLVIKWGKKQESLKFESWPATLRVFKRGGTLRVYFGTVPDQNSR